MNSLMVYAYHVYCLIYVWNKQCLVNTYSGHTHITRLLIWSVTTLFLKKIASHVFRISYVYQIYYVFQGFHWFTLSSSSEKKVVFCYISHKKEDAHTSSHDDIQCIQRPTLLYNEYNFYTRNRRCLFNMNVRAFLEQEANLFWRN